MKLDDKIYETTLYNTNPDGEVIIRFDTGYISELVEKFKEFALACGYSPKTVREYLDQEDLFLERAQVIEKISSVVFAEMSADNKIRNIKILLEDYNEEY